jgi:SMC interacting uncharacterized protein involved in chromosome segregation
MKRGPMTIDERLEKLAERHEALAQSVELLRIAQEETEKLVKAGFQETEKSFKQVAELFAQTDGFINDLARIAKSHEDRIDSLERRNPGHQ